MGVGDKKTQKPSSESEGRGNKVNDSRVQRETFELAMDVTHVALSLR